MKIKKIMRHILLVNLLSLMVMNSTVFALAPSKDVIENSKDLKELISIYRNNSNYASFSDNDIITVAREDWYEFSRIETEKAMCFDSLPAEEVIVDGITYRLYGYAHGHSLPFYTMPKGYKNFVRKAYQIENEKISRTEEINESKSLSRSGFIIAEQNLRHNLNTEDNYLIDIKDHNLFKKQDDFIYKKKDDLSPEKINHSFIIQFIVGYISSIFAPLLIAEFYSYPLTDAFDAMGMEQFRVFMSGFDIQEHSMNIEIEEGLQKKLRTHLESEARLSKIKNQNEVNGYFGDSYFGSMCTTRSLYMAGFLKSFAENGNYKEIPFFMGRAHLPEVKGFLIDSNGYAKNTEAYKMGKEKGSLLANALLAAEENDTEGVANAVAAWNPAKPPATLQELFPDLDNSPGILGLSLGFATQAFLAYKFISLLYYMGDIKLPEELLRQIAELSPEELQGVYNSLPPEDIEALRKQLL